MDIESVPLNQSEVYDWRIEKKMDLVKLLSPGLNNQKW